jgi:hypothetical protein
MWKLPDLKPLGEVIARIADALEAIHVAIERVNATLRSMDAHIGQVTDRATDQWKP